MRDASVFGVTLQDHPQNIIVKHLPPTAERKPLFIVGDVHGCARELEDLLKKAKERVSQFQLVLVGDLFTKGPDPVGVLEVIQEHNAICIKGNHDWALWASILHSHKRGIESLPEHTRQTLHLIRYHKRAVLDLVSHLPHALTTTFHPLVSRRGWEQEFPGIIVHAGIDPLAGLMATSERMLLTARYMRWEPPEGPNRKMVLVPSGYRSEVLASMSQPPHTTAPTAEHTQLRQPERFRWHELHNGPELIIFGHDAKQGLFRKTLPNGRPICLGLDTGCTYGRSLTGYFPELDDAQQVPARRTYFDITRNVIVLKNPLHRSDQG